MYYGMIYELPDGAMSFWDDCDGAEIADTYAQGRLLYVYPIECKGIVHLCTVSALYDSDDEILAHREMPSFDEMQHLRDDELYVVRYYDYCRDDGLCACVDYGIDKKEIVRNVLDRKYLEGATYFTVGSLLKYTKDWLEQIKRRPDGCEDCDGFPIELGEVFKPLGYSESGRVVGWDGDGWPILEGLGVFEPSDLKKVAG